MWARFRIEPKPFWKNKNDANKKKIERKKNGTRNNTVDIVMEFILYLEDNIKWCEFYGGICRIIINWNMREKKQIN